MSASLTTEGSLTLAVLFGTVSALATRSTGVGWVNEVQWHTSQSGFIREEETELPEGPGAMLCTLRVSNRAFGSLPNVP